MISLLRRAFRAFLEFNWFWRVFYFGMAAFLVFVFWSGVVSMIREEGPPVRAAQSGETAMSVYHEMAQEFALCFEIALAAQTPRRAAVLECERENAQNWRQNEFGDYEWVRRGCKHCKPEAVVQ
jgi:hypothetical protein